MRVSRTCRAHSLVLWLPDADKQKTPVPFRYGGLLLV